MNYFVFKNSFLSSADKKGHELSMKPKYSESLNMVSNSAGPQVNSVLPEEKNCKRLTKSAVNKRGSTDSHGEIEELEQKESCVVPKSRRNLTSSSRKRDDSTSSQEYGTECERNKSTRKNSREQNKGPQVRMLDLHKSARPKIVVKIPPDEFRNESEEEKLKRVYSRNEPGAGPESETSSKTQDKILMKGQEIEEMPCGESGKWKYIRMYQERNRKREERLRRKRQKEKEEAGKRRRSTRKRSKSKKRSKSRSRRKSRGRRSKSRSKSRRRNSSSSRGSSRSRSGRRSSRRNRR